MSITWTEISSGKRYNELFIFDIFYLRISYNYINIRSPVISHDSSY